MREVGDERGQAAVELVALLPFLALIGALLVQAAIAGQAIWLAQSAASAAARAQALGRDRELAARRALPTRLEAGLRVQPRTDGGVRLSIRIPSLWGGDLGHVGANARMAPQR